MLTGDTAVSEIHHDRASPRGSIKTEILAPVIHARHAFLHTLPPLSLFQNLLSNSKLHLPTCHSRHTRDNSACGMTSQHTCRACPFDCHTRQYLSTGRVILCSHMAYAAKSRFANLCSILGGPHRVMARPSMYDDGTTHKGHWECAPQGDPRRSAYIRYP